MTAKRLLIVDDEPRFAAFVERVAQRMGFEVEVTQHGRDFMSSYLRCTPEVVVIDMVMPDIDGNELVLWLVEQGSVANIIIITGYHPDYAVNARLLAEFKGLRSVQTLSKPVNVSRLREALVHADGGPPPRAIHCGGSLQPTTPAPT
ncbi:response regulator [Defluviicoccus vanus]|uniref:Response regulator n=1 Tax=Defluviicoccus vanus TaxID=111831 RepID=A0A7H1MZP0_9PROT|nr:response regulator [Defluviicoccus vanus]QNT68926.1 response regulator [Defluviicoccus vanus]